MTEPVQPHPHPVGEPCPGGCEDIKTVDRRLNDGSKRMSAIEESLLLLGAKLDNHMATSVETNATVIEMLAILHAGKGFFKILGYIATAIKWAAGLAAPVIVLYLSIRDWPKH